MSQAVPTRRSSDRPRQGGTVCEGPKAMLSVANVRSASGAASYFAADNDYASADADRSGQWVGSGADTLGLSGAVDAAVFDKLLKGELPDGTRVGHENQHRAGTDLTFSLPKSW